jgi:hypothetical protein
MLPSPCLDAVSMAHRFDPYWDELWPWNSSASWSMGYTERWHHEKNGRRVNAKFLLDEKEALRKLTANRGRSRRLAAWSALHAYRTVTSEQLAAITGDLTLLDPRSSVLAPSFALDLIDIGIYATPVRREPGAPRRDLLYRPASTDVFHKLIEPTLTGPEWLTVTGGQRWTSGGQYDRHNAVATEFILRCSEYANVGAVLGEKFSTVDLLAGSGLGKKVDKPDNRSADATIIRHDGLRVAIELTSNVSRGLENKVRRWARLISERPLETSGLVVVFLAAGHPNGARGKNARRSIYETVSRVLREFPGTGTDSPAARIGCASWTDYFPARHHLSDLFLRLEADFAIGSGSGAAKWIPRGLLDEYSFTPWKSFDALAVVEQSPLIAATPHWMRHPGTDLTHLIGGSPMDRAGIAVPHPAPANPKLAKGHPLGAGVGSAGDTKLPRRLRIVG